MPHERVVFARELRRVRQQTGLTLVALAERTTASKSSWQRYLSGAQLPPRGVVRELCELAGRKPGPLLALWELAEASRHRRQPPVESGERPAAADAEEVPEVPPTPPGPARDVSESTTRPRRSSGPNKPGTGPCRPFGCLPRPCPHCSRSQSWAWPS
ncbi:helix-turn-helix domain-containing protein [Streptomyces sp. SID4931]|nr:helix-turn-helix domain-containing protein [Streptomyces sp. SID4931]